MTSILKVDNIQGANGTDIPYVKGHVLQMPFTQYTSTTEVSMSANTNKAVDVLAVNITPKSTSSIIRLDAHVFHEWNQTNAAADSVWFFYRDTTKLAAPQTGSRLSGISLSSLSYFADDSGSTPETIYYSYFDQPATTSQITYKIGILSHYSTSVFINRSKTDTDSTQYERGISFISATEIGG